MTTRKPKKVTRPSRVAKSRGNVFADLGLANAEPELMKAQLTLQIYRIIKQRGLTQIAAAKVLGVPQPHVSLLMRNRVGTFSVGRLMEFLTAVGQDVEVTVLRRFRELTHLRSPKMTHPVLAESSWPVASATTKVIIRYSDDFVMSRRFTAPRRGKRSPPGPELLGVITSHGPFREFYTSAEESSGWTAEAPDKEAAREVLSAQRV